jgi:hypothetical protein
MLEGMHEDFRPVRTEPLVRQHLGRDGWVKLHKLAVLRGRRPSDQVVAMLRWALARAIEGADTGRARRAARLGRRRAGGRMTVTRSVSTIELLGELIDEVRAIKERLGAQSSVQINTSTRGHDITVKVYAGSPVREVVDEAIAEYFRAFREAERKLMGGD